MNRELYCIFYLFLLMIYVLYFFYRTKTILTVMDLARKNPRILRKKSQLYLWNLLTVAVFYALPVVQLVITYQYVSDYLITFSLERPVNLFYHFLNFLSFSSFLMSPLISVPCRDWNVTFFWYCDLFIERRFAKAHAVKFFQSHGGSYQSEGGMSWRRCGTC